MADKKKAGAPAAAAPPEGPNYPALLDALRAQLTQRTDELLGARGEGAALAARVAALTAALAEAQQSGRDVAEVGARAAKEREAFLQADLARKDQELARAHEALALATERVVEVQRESEAALKAKVAQLAALRSRMEDITDQFNENLSELKRRMDAKLGALSAEVDGAEGGSGAAAGGGIRAAMASITLE